MQKISSFEIFRVFFKIGLILLGGGYVIVPIVKQELVEKRHWINDDELIDFYTVAQCLSGIIAINTAIFISYKIASFRGLFFGVLGMCLSPIISILIIVNLIQKIMQFSFIEAIFWGVNISVIILIYLSIKDVWAKSIVDKFSIFWFILILALALAGINPVILIILSILFGLFCAFKKEIKND